MSSFHGHRCHRFDEIEGDIVDQEGVSEEGMLMDFSDGQILTVYIHDVVDHAFVVYEGDEEAINVLSQLSSDHRTVVRSIYSNCRKSCKVGI